jgi:hypothetical protein
MLLASGPVRMGPELARIQGRIVPLSCTYGRVNNSGGRDMRSTTSEHQDSDPSDFRSAFARASLALESAVLELLAGDWEEGPRRLAHDIAVALLEAAREERWWDIESTLRAIESLLSLSSHEALSIRRALDERLLNFLALLKKGRESRSA